jgi:hypothetical protein
LLRSLTWRFTRALAGAFVAVLALGAVAALVRLLPWLLDSRVSWGVTGRFAWPLGLAAVEVAAIVALPLGAALASADLQDRGEGLACLLCGVSPWWLAARLGAGGVVLAALGAGAGLLASAEAAHPDATVHAWISAARASCGPRRPVSEVPGLGASWLCAPDASPWLVMTPAEGLVVQARQVTVEQGGRWRLAGSRWSLRGPPEVDLQAAEASLAAGSASWTRRAPRLWLAPGALLGAWLLGGALLATLEGRRWVAVALGSACAGALLSLQGAADAGHLAPRWLALQPLLAALPGVLWWGHRGP